MVDQEQRAKMTRRDFFSYLTVGWVTYGAAISAMLGFVFRYLYPNVKFEPPMTFIAGKVSDFATDGVDERFKNGFGVWIVRSEGQLFALSNICTHLGCIPNWLSAESKFKCPCHGSGFYVSGINFEGPAPRPLERYKIGVNAQGYIVVDKTKVYRQEKGQWNNADSYIKV